uniref:Helitron helicase-like domain-containing protein n=1 Tax=Lactuca sativa TaxID=4236 RepID=A0A9R1XHH9_LACSA|nr:hypothetical protein LSAT_V11C300108020 [Lactuca sativa]
MEMIYGNPQYFIMFTCDLKWPEITSYMDAHHQTNPQSRADINAGVFNIQVHDFIRFLKEDKTFGVVEACMFSIWFPFYLQYLKNENKLVGDSSYDYNYCHRKSHLEKECMLKRMNEKKDEEDKDEAYYLRKIEEL